MLPQLTGYLFFQYVNGVGLGDDSDDDDGVQLFQALIHQNQYQHLCQDLPDLNLQQYQSEDLLVLLLHLKILPQLLGYLFFQFVNGVGLGDDSDDDDGPQLFQALIHQNQYQHRCQDLRDLDLQQYQSEDLLVLLLHLGQEPPCS